MLLVWKRRQTDHVANMVSEFPAVCSQLSPLSIPDFSISILIVASVTSTYIQWMHFRMPSGVISVKFCSHVLEQIDVLHPVILLIASATVAYFNLGNLKYSVCKICILECFVVTSLCTYVQVFILRVINYWINDQCDYYCSSKTGVLLARYYQD